MPIMLCRDGVGDGQINYVLEHEIKAIEKCFHAAGINQADLKFTYIIVSKRINTRFFRYGLAGSLLQLEIHFFGQ